MENFHKVEKSRAIRLVPGVWSRHAEKWLGQVALDATIGDLYRQYLGGGKVVYLEAGGEIVGAALLVVSVTASGRSQGVIVAAAARLNEIDITADCLPGLESMFQGVEEIRIHTERPGLAKKLAMFGYQATEMVLVKRVMNG